ncbi:MAG TPA: recombinase family protein [Methanothrix sp.]|nr:recombinase family protein [Methanothrix sp.]HOL44319.1 recombinase family protein [Methanothrix sp.]
MKQNNNSNTTPRIMAYVRVSTDEQDTDKQRHEILEYANRQKWVVDHIISSTMSSRASRKKRRIEELMSMLAPGDTLIISELSRLGRSVPEVINLVNTLSKNNIRLIAIKENIDIRGEHDNSTTSKVMVTMFSLLAELERDLISQRTKAALRAVKEKGIKLGRPVGRLGRSKLDGKEKEIEIFLAKRVPIAAIARIVGCSRQGLVNYLQKKKLYSPKRERCLLRQDVRERRL